MEEKNTSKNWSHFVSRPRYPTYKDASGRDVQYKTQDGSSSFYYYERLWVGRLAKAVDFIKPLVESGIIKNKDSVVYVLCVGSQCDIIPLEESEDRVGTYKYKPNVVLLWSPDDKTIIKNKYNNKNGDSYVDFLKNEVKADVVEADLPYVTHSRTGSGSKPTDVDSAIKNALKQADALKQDVGF